MKHLLQIFVLILGTCWQIHAQSVDNDEASESKYAFKQLIQEFLRTEAVYPQEKGEVQFTTSHYYTPQTNFTTANTSLLVEYGITQFLQIEAEMPYLWNDPNPGEAMRGFGDLEVGLLYNFWNKRQISVSAVLEAGIPTGNQDQALGNGVVAWEPKLVLANQWGKLQTHLDVGLEFTSEETEYAYNLAAIYPLGAFKVVTELNGSYEQASDKPDQSQWFITPALIWNGVPGLEVALGSSIKLDGEQTVQFGFRLTFEFETIED